MKKGHIEVVKYLIERGAFVNSKDEGYVTPLHQACELGSAEIALRLVNNGADLEIENWVMLPSISLHFLCISNPCISLFFCAGSQDALGAHQGHQGQRQA